MTQSVIGALRVNLGLDSAQFEKGARRSQDTLKNMRTQFAAVAGVAAAMGATLSAAALRGAADIDKAAKSARRLDSSIGGFRAIELAADEAGVSLSSLTSDLQTMNRELANIGVSGNADRALERLGISVSDLANLDADEKLATIADRIKALGLTSGETTAVLRDFGIRNREMVLLVGQGGDAIRSARADIESYGLAVSQVDSDRIEAANDAIGRLGLIGQYAGQQLAIALVPAMGRVAEAMTESLRAGGLLRTVIDGLVGSLGQITATVGVAVVAFGTRYVGAMVAAKLATFSVSGALIALRSVIKTSIFGAMIVGAGLAVDWFARLVSAAGGFGNALDLLRNVATEVWQRIGEGMNVLETKTLEVGARMKAAWLDALSFMQDKWADFLRSISGIAQKIPGMSILAADLKTYTLNAGRAKNATDALAASEREAASNFADQAENATIYMGRRLESLAALKKAMEVAAEGTEAAATATAEYEAALDEIGGSGGTAGKTTKEVEKLTEAVQGPFGDAVDNAAQAFGDFFANGLRDFKSFSSSILDGFKRMISQMIATAVANPIKIGLGIGGSALGSPALAAGGGGGLLGGAGGLLGGLGTIASGFGTGLTGAFTALTGTGAFAGAGGFGAMGSYLSSSFATASSGALGLGTALGAVALPLAGVVAAISFFSSKTSTLDRGLRLTADSTGILVEEFERIKKSRFWGLSTSKRTNFNEAGEEIAGPIEAAVAQMQASIVKAAESLGTGQQAFADFAYNAKISLKGLSDEEATQKVGEELAKLGDAFASIVPHISSMSELLAAAGERFQIENRLLQLQGKDSELLARLREQELGATHELNKELLKTVFALEDQVSAQAAAAVIADERAGLERRLLELQGDTAELRRRELDALNPANRALQLMIWGLEDAKKALDAIDPSRFATLFDFNKARAFARISSVANSVTAPAYVPSQTAPVSVDRGTDVSVLAEVRALREVTTQLLLRSDQNIKKLADLAIKDDAIGAPVRVIS